MRRRARTWLTGAASVGTRQSPLKVGSGTRPSWLGLKSVMHSLKSRLPKGRSYPLKASVLEAAILGAGLTLPVELTRRDDRNWEAALVATFIPQDPWHEGEHIWVRCRAVASEQAAAVRALLEGEAIPRFIKWAKQIEALDARSPQRGERQHFTRPYPAGAE